MAGTNGKTARTKELMLFFVHEILGRGATPADFHGRHMKSASKVLNMGYSYDDITGALIAVRDRNWSAFHFDRDRLPARLDCIDMLWLWGEPALIDRYITPPPMPEVWSGDYERWVQMYGRTAILIGMWDGVWTKTDPRREEEWLMPIIGEANLRKSVRQYGLRTQSRG